MEKILKLYKLFWLVSPKKTRPLLKKLTPQLVSFSINQTASIDTRCQDWINRDLRCIKPLEKTSSAEVLRLLKLR